MLVPFTKGKVGRIRYEYYSIHVGGDNIDIDDQGTYGPEEMFRAVARLPTRLSAAECLHVVRILLGQFGTDGRLSGWLDQLMELVKDEPTAKSDNAPSGAPDAG